MADGKTKKYFFMLVFFVTLWSMAGKSNIILAATSSSNIHLQNYTMGLAMNGDNGNPVISHLIFNPDGTLNRVEEVDNTIIVEGYLRESFIFLGELKITKELPAYGGFFAGKNYNFFVFGKCNYEEDDSQEVIRIVKYTKDWKRVESASLYGLNTQEPFDGGSLRMCEYGDILYIRTCHKMYKSSDGKNHQANMTICYNQKTNTITDNNSSEVCNTSKGYVSHSFNQFIIADENQLVTLDHGDGYPRAFILMNYGAKAGMQSLSGIQSYANILSFPGEYGMNYTGASVGGLESSKNNYMAAYNSVDQEWFYSPVRNVYLSMVGKNNVSNSNVITKQFTSFSPTGDRSASNPTLVKVSEDEFYIMWEIYDADEINVVNGKPGLDTIQYVKIDGNGNALGEVHTEKANLSDCAPLVIDNQIIWYVTDNSEPQFYCIDLATETLANTYRAPIAENTKDLSLTEDATVQISSEGMLTGLLQSQNSVGEIRKQFASSNLVFKNMAGIMLEDDALLGTGATISVMDGDTVKASCEVVLVGDVNGDGKVGGKDVSMLAQSFVQKATLNDAQRAAGDTKEDGSLDGKDVSKLAQSLVGKNTISSQTK